MGGRAGGYDIVLPLLAAAGTGNLVVESFASRVSGAKDKEEVCEVEEEGETTGSVQPKKGNKVVLLERLPDECDLDYQIRCDAAGVAVEEVDCEV